jgi:hypothetical protein
VPLSADSTVESVVGSTFCSTRTRAPLSSISDAADCYDLAAEIESICVHYQARIAYTRRWLAPDEAAALIYAPRSTGIVKRATDSGAPVPFRTWLD